MGAAALFLGTGWNATGFPNFGPGLNPLKTSLNIIRRIYPCHRLRHFQSLFVLTKKTKYICLHRQHHFISCKRIFQQMHVFQYFLAYSSVHTLFFWSVLQPAIRLFFQICHSFLPSANQPNSGKS